jgi:predicted dehydrogenase
VIRPVLVVGGGAIVRRAHLPALTALERAGRVRICGVVEPDASAAALVATEFRVPVFRSLDEGLARAEANTLLDVCSPSSAHLEAIAAGLERGLPLLVEKPLLTGRDALAGLVERLAGRPAPPLLLVQNYRYYSCVGRALERVSRGALGRVSSLTGFAPTRFPVSWTRSTWLYDEGGVLLDFAPHAFDLFVLFAGAPLRRVSAFGGDVTGGRMGFTNYAQVQAEFEGGLLASLDASWITGSNMFTLGVHGTGGHVDLDVRSDAFREYHGTYTPFDDLRDFRARVSASARRLVSGEFFRGPLVFYVPLLEDVLLSLEAGEPASPRVATLAQGLNGALLLQAALESIAGGRVVELDEVAGERGARLLRELYASEPRPAPAA